MITLEALYNILGLEEPEVYREKVLKSEIEALSFEEVMSIFEKDRITHFRLNNIIEKRRTGKTTYKIISSILNEYYHLSTLFICHNEVNVKTSKMYFEYYRNIVSKGLQCSLELKTHFVSIHNFKSGYVRGGTNRDKIIYDLN